MTLDEAKKILSECERSELVDHAFGDAEVDWNKDGKEIAAGYFGGTSESVGFNDADHTTFMDKEARELRQLGKLVASERNDETGPDEYKEGTCMHALTPAGVLEELTEDGHD